MNFFNTFVKKKFMKAGFFSCCLLFLIGIFSSCSTDFDINGDPKEIAVVYGLIDQNDTTHFVKITKAFLGNSSIYDMAKDSSLSSFGNDLSVRVYETSDGSVSRTFNLSKTIITNKDTGIFYSPNQEVYTFNTLPLFNESKSVEIEITNNASGAITTATTALINDFQISKPTYNDHNPLISFVNSNGDYMTNSKIEFLSAKNGRIYDCYFRFNYTEVNKTTSESFSRHIDWLMGQQKASTLDGGELISYTILGESFFKLLQTRLTVDNNLERIIGKIELHIDVGSDDLSIYLDLNKPASSVVQDRPLYTNVSNGIGIFTCRHSKVLSFNFSTYTIQKLIEGEYTSALGFKQ